MGKYSRYWEMKEGGPYGEEIFEADTFKCTKCGAVTHHPDGYDGEPDLHQCSHDCQMDHGDWVAYHSSLFVRNYPQIHWHPSEEKPAEPEKTENLYKNNFGNIFPDSPGAGL